MPEDPKALYRRCVANDGLENVENAYKDAREVHRLDPNNKAIQPYLTKLHKAFSEKLTLMSQTSNKVKNMFEIVFDPNQDLDRRQKGADNLVVLAREASGADVLFKEGVVPNIVRLMKVEKNPKIRLSIIRCIGELCKKTKEICKEVLKSCGIPFFLDILNTKDEETVTASSYVIQIILDTMSDAAIMKKVKELKKNPRAMSSADRKWCMEEEKKRFEMIKGIIIRLVFLLFFTLLRLRREQRVGRHLQSHHFQRYLQNDEWRGQRCFDRAHNEKLQVR